MRYRHTCSLVTFFTDAPGGASKYERIFRDILTRPKFLNVPTKDAIVLKSVIYMDILGPACIKKYIIKRIVGPQAYTVFNFIIALCSWNLAMYACDTAAQAMQVLPSAISEERIGKLKAAY